MFTNSGPLFSELCTKSAFDEIFFVIELGGKIEG